MEPLFDLLPGSRMAFVLYVVLSSWAILSILTAVVSDNMIRVAQAAKDEESQGDELQHAKNCTAKLKEILGNADVHNDGLIDRHEFERLLEKGQQSSDELCDAAGGVSR